MQGLAFYLVKATVWLLTVILYTKDAVCWNFFFFCIQLVRSYIGGGHLTKHMPDHEGRIGSAQSSEPL